MPVLYFSTNSPGVMYEFRNLGKMHDLDSSYALRAWSIEDIISYYQGEGYYMYNMIEVRVRG